jgi:hypothetical protein
MKHIQAFESFKKNYKEKINPFDFKEIELGKTVLYGGGSHEVIDNDGFILTLKNKSGKITKVNLNQFNDKGAINEARSIEKIEKDRSKVIGDMAVTVKDWKAAKESGDKKSEEAILKKLKDFTAKKKSLEKELNDKISDKDKDIQLVINEESDISLDESIWPKSKLPQSFQFVLASELKKNFKGIFYSIGNDVYHNDKKMMAVDGDKDSVNSIIKQLKSKIKESVNEETEPTNEISETEINDKSFFDHWSDLYGENFIKEYPKLAKLIKMHPHVDARTLSKWWDEIYGEDFKKKYPAMWNKLNVKI